MAKIHTDFGLVDERHMPFGSPFTKRKPSKEINEEFYETVSSKSVAAKRELKYENIRYGSKPRESLDIFYPQKVTPETALVIFYHGGYWQEGSTDVYFFMAKPITRAGKICVLAGRTIVPESNVRGILHQNARSMHCIAERFPNASDITLWGHSSGAHECAMMLSADWSTFSAEACAYMRQKLKRVVPVCGIFEVTHLMDTAVDDSMNMTWSEAKELSPIAHIGQLAKNVADTKCELILITVENEAPTILKWTKIYERELKAAGVSFKSKFLKNFDHFNVIQTLDEENSLTMKWVLEGDEASVET